MPSVSNIAVGAAMAGAAAQKARHQMNESIARLSTGIRSMYGGDAAGQSVANSLGAKGASLPLLLVMQRTVFPIYSLLNLYF
tara:strand:+ start:1406 stop:1651 length:246 start_codon:yes stop_codon:yes gene_type:complete